MKKIFKNYLITLFVTLFFPLFMSLILTFLNVNNLMNQKYLLIITYIISYMFFAILAYIFGIKTGKHGLIHGIILSLMMLIVSVVFSSNIYTIANIIKISTKSLVVIFFTILGVNKKNS